MTREELIEGLRTLNAPDQGMRYHGGGQVEGARYDSRTGEPLRPIYRSAELTVHGTRARFLYRLIESASELADGLSTPQPADGCSSNEGAGAWDREICTGCTSSLSIADIKARGIVSCCPDRHMVRVGDLIDAYTARPPRILPQTEKGS